MTRESAAPRALTFEEVGEALGVSAQTVRRMVRDRTLHAVRISARIQRVPVAEVERLLATRDEGRAT